MAHIYPVIVGLLLVLLAAAVGALVLGGRERTALAERADIAESRADDAEQLAANRALRIRHYREQADQLRAALASRDYCGQVAAAALALDPDACNDPLEALYALPAYDSEETS